MDQFPFASRAMEALISFVLETDRLKSVYRQTWLSDRTRRENAAEHSWHLALMALLFADEANAKGIDLLRVLKMLLVHDIVEIDAGDTFAYDTKGHEDKEARERAAADRLFGLLPDGPAREMHELWREFEERRTPEARFACALDRFQPMLLNFVNEGKTWRDHGVKKHQVLSRNAVIGEGSDTLWEVAQQLVDEAVRRGYLSE